MDTAARLLRLLSLLQTRPHWDGAELASRLEVTPRTVRRDVTRLRSLGYPVDADAGHGGGYHLGHGGRLPPLLLDDEEAVAIAVGLRVATTTTISGVEESAIAALAKLHHVLPIRLREQVAAVAGSTIQLPRGELPSVDSEVLVALAAGCRRTEGIRFSYRDHAGQESERSVEPFHIVHTGRRWYLVARDRDRDAWRTFRIDRIVAPTLTGHRYRFDDPPDPVALVAEGTGIIPWEIEARVLVHASAEVVAQAFPPGDGVLEAVDATSCVLRFGAGELAPLVAHAARIPWEFEVLAPEDLREAIRALGERLARATARTPAGVRGSGS